MGEPVNPPMKRPMNRPMNRPIASGIHTAFLIAILAGFAWWSAIHAAHLRATGSTHHLALYLQTLVFEWLLLAFVIWGVRRHGGALSAVLGDRWSGARELGRDLGVAAVYWVVTLIALAVISHLLGMNGLPDSVRFLLPRGWLEIVLWVALSVTAGICEEAIFRGYLQRQFLALTQNAPAAIALGAVAFGAGHAYQGARSAVLISLYGAMFGSLAHWRKTVRPGMIAHAWQDSFSGIVTSLRRS